MVSVSINGHCLDVVPGTSIFDAATRMGVRIPTSCVAQGKCKECIVEIGAGMDLLAARSEHERHLSGRFRLSCQSTVTASEGAVECHTMRRGQMPKLLQPPGSTGKSRTAAPAAGWPSRSLATPLTVAPALVIVATTEKS